MLQKIRTQGASQLVYDELKKAIVSGSLAPGSRLVERDLAARLGVSRTPVHEAINRLEAEHLVLRLPNKRVVVAQISLDDLHQLYTLRASLEVLTVRWAMPRMTPAIIAELRRNIAQMVACHGTGDLQRIAKLNFAFHRVILATGNSFYLTIFMEKIHDATRLFRTQSIFVPGRVEKILEDHQRIVQAFEDQDTQAAIGLITDHVNGALRALAGQYQTAGPAAQEG